MRSFLVWMWLLLKRLLKKPAFICLLAIMPILAIVFGLLGRGIDRKPAVGIAWEDSLVMAEAPEWDMFLTDSVNTIDYRIYDSVDALIWAVKGEEITCGFVIPKDIAADLTAQTWQGKIIVYVGEDETVAWIVKEELASALFTIYAEENYVNLIKESAKGTEISEREIADFAMTAYETHLSDGSTFAFNYEESVQKKTDQTVTQSIGGQNLSEQSITTWATLSPLRGILAICVFLCGICGLLTDCYDRQNRRFVRMSSDRMTTMVNIWIPMIPASFMMLISLYIGSYVSNISDTVARIGEIQIGKEILRLLIYQLLIILYCSIIRMVLRKREQIAVIIPILTLGSLICGPVWMRLALYLPVFRVLEKFFPVTWYLLL